MSNPPPSGCFYQFQKISKEFTLKNIAIISCTSQLNIFKKEVEYFLSPSLIPSKKRYIPTENNNDFIFAIKVIGLIKDHLPEIKPSHYKLLVLSVKLSKGGYYLSNDERKSLKGLFDTFFIPFSEKLQQLYQVSWLKIESKEENKLNSIFDKIVMDLEAVLKDSETIQSIVDFYGLFSDSREYKSKIVNTFVSSGVTSLSKNRSSWTILVWGNKTKDDFYKELDTTWGDYKDPPLYVLKKMMTYYQNYYVTSS